MEKHQKIRDELEVRFNTSSVVEEHNLDKNEITFYTKNFQALTLVLSSILPLFLLIVYLLHGFETKHFFIISFLVFLTSIFLFFYFESLNKVVLSNDKKEIRIENISYFRSIYDTSIVKYNDVKSIGVEFKGKDYDRLILITNSNLEYRLLDVHVLVRVFGSSDKLADKILNIIQLNDSKS